MYYTVNSVRYITVYSNIKLEYYKKYNIKIMEN